MDVNIINPVLQSFAEVMPQLGFSNIEKKGISLKSKYIESSGVEVIIGLTGDIKGSIIYGIQNEGAKRVASQMMMGMPVNELDELAQSAISELINMLTANVATIYSRENINVDISTPTLIRGEFTTNATVEKVICVEMSVDGIIFEVNISLEKTL